MPLEFKMYSYIGPGPLRTTVPLLPAPSRKSTTSSTAQTPPPNGLPSPPEFANSYQLDIISALRGNDHNFLSRAAVADAIASIDNNEHKVQLIDFLAAEHGAIALTIENNACKMFECTPGELFVVARRMEQAAAATIGEDGTDSESHFGQEQNWRQQSQEIFLTKLVQLFRTTLGKIVPNAFGMLYPLQQFDPSFQIRTIILHSFRDRVLLSLLDNFRFDHALFEHKWRLERELRQMFMLINFDVRDESDESGCFEQIFDEFLCRNPTNQNNASDEEKDGNGKNCANEGNGADADADNCEKTTTSAAEMPMQKRKIGMSLKATCSSGQRGMQRAIRSMPNSMDISIARPLDTNAELGSSQPAMRCGQQQQRYRKSFLPSSNIFLSREVPMAREGKQIMQKQRARTMPSKTVTFWDEESNVDV